MKQQAFMSQQKQQRVIIRPTESAKMWITLKYKLSKLDVSENIKEDIKRWISTIDCEIWQGRFEKYTSRNSKTEIYNNLN